MTGGGSGTGIIANQQHGQTSPTPRAMKESEIEDARKNEPNPQEFTVAIDALAVIVNQANPSTN